MPPAEVADRLSRGTAHARTYDVRGALGRTLDQTRAKTSLAILLPSRSWQKVALRGGRSGWFRALSCGGSCSPPLIEWVSRGNLYSIQAKVPDSSAAGQRRRLVAAANSAIGAGPR